MRLGLWTLKERKNRCDLIEVFKMNNGYIQIDIRRVLFTFDGNDKGLRAIIRKFLKQDLPLIVEHIFF